MGQMQGPHNPISLRAPNNPKSSTAYKTRYVAYKIPTSLFELKMIHLSGSN